MLVIQALVDQPEQGIKKGDQFNLYLVDAHHHMGREGGHRNTPIGAYEFYMLLWFELKEMAKKYLEDDRLRFKPVSVTSPKLPTRVFNARKPWKQMNHGWMVDRTIVFPYSDDYAKNDSGVVSFKVSNDKMAGWSTRAPHSTRLIGFMRVDPTDEVTLKKGVVIKEIDRCANHLGLRGVKLHPIAQLFIDEIESESTKNVFLKAGMLSLPIIIDTRNIRTVLKVKSLIDSINQNNAPCVILAHAGMSPSDPQLYEVLSHPKMYCETSSIHGFDVPLLFDMASNEIKSEWSSKILFGTDYSFLSTQANEVILHLLSQEFPGTLSDIQSILGGNAMRLVQAPFTSDSFLSTSPHRITSTRSPARTRKLLEKELLRLISLKKWDILSLDMMIPGSERWPQPSPLTSGGYNGIHFKSYLISLKSPNSEMFQLWIRESPRQFLSCANLSRREVKEIRQGVFSPQRLNAILIDSILDTSELVDSPDQLVRRVHETLYTPNKS